MKHLHRFTSLLLILLFVLQAMPLSAQNEWKLKTDKDGVQVYMRGEESSSYKTVKTVCTLKTSLSSVAAILLDVTRTPEWVYGTKACKLLKQESPTTLYYYAEMGMPWPVSNRDFIIRIAMSQHPQTQVITVTATNLPTYIPPQDGIVRIQRSSGLWTISPLPNGQVRVEYVLQVDPGGSLPASIVNMFSYNGPFQSFKNLFAQVKKDPYPSAHLPFIVN